MSGWEITIGVIIILISLFLIGVIMLQEGNSRGMGGMAPSSGDSYLENNKNRTFEAMLARLTKVGAVLFFVLTILINILSVIKK
ncbi:MAG: preprotein translocase subunit SecG [Oscillospiraceae bacterium]|nr:preprotein translocase subunit SecG [Oscillospiraceae bacterium]